MIYKQRIEAKTPRLAAMEAVRATFASSMEEYILIDEKTPQNEAKRVFDNKFINN